MPATCIDLYQYISLLAEIKTSQRSQGLSNRDRTGRPWVAFAEAKEHRRVNWHNITHISNAPTVTARGHIFRLSQCNLSISYAGVKCNHVVCQTNFVTKGQECLWDEVMMLEG